MNNHLPFATDEFRRIIGHRLVALGRLTVIMRSDEVRGILEDLVRRALTVE